MSEEWISCPEVLQMMINADAIQPGDMIMHKRRDLCRITRITNGQCKYDAYQYNMDMATSIYAHLITAWRRPCAKETKQ